MADDEFFVAKRAAAVLKHGILQRYVLPFAMKVTSTAKDGRVVVLDGYAGEGRYEDGSPGSPIFMAETARKLLTPRRMELHFVEQKKARFKKLKETLADEASDIEYQVYKGEVEKHLDAILSEADGVPFFGFLDPCGLGLTFDDIVKKIYARPYGNYSPGTEVLINFSAEAVRRIGGRLKEPVGAQGREATLDRMDKVCGGDWWRAIYTASKSPEEAAECIANEYFQRLITATGAGGWVIPVKNAEHQQAKYSLVFLSRHRDGLLLLGEALSGSLEDWRKAVVDSDSLYGDPDYVEAAEEVLVRGWIDHMKENVTELLDTKPRFLISTEYTTVMGETAGEARMTHLRIALKELKAKDVVSSDGKGSPLWNQYVVKA
ncbi:MAG: three-Cys-motif partner protein TcmP [Jatrophihabitantaceae bacterium]